MTKLLDKDEGVVLFSRKLGESDALTHIYTRGQGKQQYIFKGMRKSKKRSGWIMGGNHVLFRYYFSEKKTAYYAKDLDILYSPFAYNPDHVRVELLYNFLHLIEKKVYFGDPQPLLFELLQGFVSNIAGAFCEQPMYLYFFVRWRLLKYLGLVNWPIYCSLCGKKLNKDNIFLPNNYREFVCRECLTAGGGLDARGSLAFSKAEWLLLHQSLRLRWGELTELGLTEKQKQNTRAMQDRLLANLP
jgi:DNA repair protein RecO (recombination protein O)